jgi:hypothetical protein
MRRRPRSPRPTSATHKIRFQRRMPWSRLAPNRIVAHATRERGIHARARFGVPARGGSAFAPIPPCSGVPKTSLVALAAAGVRDEHAPALARAPEHRLAPPRERSDRRLSAPDAFHSSPASRAGRRIDRGESRAPGHGRASHERRLGASAAFFQPTPGHSFGAPGSSSRWAMSRMLAWPSRLRPRRLSLEPEAVAAPLAGEARPRARMRVDRVAEVRRLHAPKSDASRRPSCARAPTPLSSPRDLRRPGSLRVLAATKTFCSVRAQRQVPVTAGPWVSRSSLRCWARPRSTKCRSLHKCRSGSGPARLSCRASEVP